MRRRLFWKILFGFWLTFIIATESVWLLYAVLRPVPSDTTRALARISIAAATSAINLGGPSLLNRQLASWPVDERGRLIVRPWSADSHIQHDINRGSISARAEGPSGHSYWIVYQVRRFAGYGHGPLDIPREILALAVIGGLAFSATLAWYLTNPIRQMRVGFARLSSGDFSTRLGKKIGRRKDEIADLAHDFDKMAVHLEELVSARDKLLADVSHELRSPLARLQMAVELAHQDPAALDFSLGRIRLEAGRLDELVGELLTLSKLESRALQPEEYFDVTEVVKSVVDDANFEAASKGVKIETAVTVCADASGWIVLGSGKLMARAIENILRNAIRFSREGQTVSVAIREETARFVISIDDDGPGVPDGLLGTLFEPFTQGVSESQGFGLGLAIARRAVIAHKGIIFAENRSPNGLRIVLSLPVTATQIRPEAMACPAA